MTFVKSQIKMLRRTYTPVRRKIKGGKGILQLKEDTELNITTNVPKHGRILRFS